MAMCVHTELLIFCLPKKILEDGGIRETFPHWQLKQKWCGNGFCPFGGSFIGTAVEYMAKSAISNASTNNSNFKSSTDNRSVQLNQRLHIESEHYGLDRWSSKCGALDQGFVKG
ncbi:hypothetical protein ATANTOWER_014308 [Ataeniobius toweri]|uniref:Uncharacterized protein n=1 Tax=Ataeniobius toweri TaxID=208326 RepID=A0ABU7CAL2_9TELE|nr:hypothetical protein [Ataeniobius toweri]